MGIIKNFTTMNAKQKLALKRNLRSFFTHPVVVFGIAIVCLIALHMAYAAV